jgi:hypothetical protein
MLQNKSSRPVAVLGVLMMLVAGCRAPAPQIGASAGPAASPTAATPSAAPVEGAGGSWSQTRAGAALYEIDAAHSLLRLLVYRGGAMAAVGHDHVIQNRALAGWVDPAAADTQAVFYLEIPDGEFSVDEVAARAEEGPDFAEEVSADAKAGTRHNMLSAALLDAAAHPVIAIRGSELRGTGTHYQATVQIAIAGHLSTQRIFFDATRSADLLTATAEFPLRQSALGLTPFSVMLGALRVEDEIRVKLRLVAVPRR